MIKDPGTERVSMGNRSLQNLHDSWLIKSTYSVWAYSCFLSLGFRSAWVYS